MRNLVITFALALASTLLVAQAPPAATAYVSTTYRPLTGKERIKWVVTSTIGPESLATGLFSAGWNTASNSPKDYGPHWEGFAKRYGMRFTGVSTSNAMEAGLGAIWNEDPRYFRTGEPFKGRVKNIVLMTFEARREDGRLVPAYARFIATPGSNFLSNTWRADSVATNHDAALRTVWGFAGRMGSNAFAEFWPDVNRHVFHKNH